MTDHFLFAWMVTNLVITSILQGIKMWVEKDKMDYTEQMIAKDQIIEIKRLEYKDN